MILKEETLHGDYELDYFGVTYLAGLAKKEVTKKFDREDQFLEFAKSP